MSDIMFLLLCVSLTCGCTQHYYSSLAGPMLARVTMKNICNSKIIACVHSLQIHVVYKKHFLMVQNLVPKVLHIYVLCLAWIFV